MSGFSANISRNRLQRNARGVRRRFRQYLAQGLGVLALWALAGAAHAVPLLLNWETVNWSPNGSLSQTYNVGGYDVVVTVSGNTAGLTGSTPQLNTQNTGGLAPAENSLNLAADYADASSPQITVTWDFSAFPAGVSGIDFSVFDVDATTDSVDRVQATALTTSGPVDPSSRTTGAANALAGSNGIQGSVGAADTSADGTARFQFSQTGITSLVVVYSNEGVDGSGNPGLQAINLHDIAFNATESPQIGLAKDVTSGPTSNGDGTYTVTYTLTVENLGNTDLNDIQVADKFAATFSAAESYIISSLVSDDFTVTPGFDGQPGNSDLLDGTDSLAPGESGTIEVTAIVTPGSNLGPYVNSAAVIGTTPGGITDSDVSTDGTDSDPDGNGNPANNAVPTPVTFVESPQIGVAKTVSAGPVDNGDGSFTLTYRITISNTGDIVLNGMQVSDDLSAAFAAASSVSVDSVSSPDFTLNPGYDGSSDTDLLGGGDTLASGASGVIDLIITVIAGGSAGPYANTATGTGVSLAGTGVGDDSTDGTDVDPDGDGNPGNNSVPTEVSLVAEDPEIGLAKEVTAGPVNNGDGTYTLTYTMTVENTGNVPLNDIQLADKFAATFAGSEDFVIDGVVSTDLTIDPNFTGLPGGSDMLIGSDTLLPGETASVEVTVTVTPGDNLGPYLNSSAIIGTSPSGTVDSDVSTDGPDPDPDGDGLPGNNAVPTPITFTENPQIGAAKFISSGPAGNGDGTFTLAYDILVANTGDIVLNGVQVAEDLAAVFAGVGFVVDSVSSANLTVNPLFDGDADTGLLDGDDTLVVGGTGTVTLVVTLSPGLNPGPYSNTATAFGTSPATTVVSDDSTDGASVDPDFDGNPGNNSAPTDVTLVVESPQIGMAKEVTAGPVNNGDGTYTLTYTLVVENTGNVQFDNVQIADKFAATFTGSDNYIIDSVSSTDLTIDPAFTGLPGASDMLTGIDTLLPGESASVEVTVTVTPGDDLGPYLNSSAVVGTTPGGIVDSDVSTDGPDPDPDGDGLPGNNAVPTPVSFTENPVIGIAKAISAGPTGNGDGTFTLTYAIVVANSGDIVLNGVQVTEDLSAAFAGAAFTVDSLGSADLTVNPLFDGSAETNLLTGVDALSVGESGSVSLTVSVTPGGNPGPYDNTAFASATSPASVEVTDASTDGSDVDPDGDGDPGNNNASTPVTFVQSPQLGLAKSVSAGPASNGDGTYVLTYTVLAANTGDAELDNLQLTDDLAAAFATATAFTLDAVSSTDFTVNPGFDGISDTGLLAGSDNLAIGETGTVAITVTVTPGGNLGPYSNSALGDAVSVGVGAPVSDVSASGANPDPDADGDPGNNSDPTSVSFAEMPQLGAAKAVAAGPLSNGDGSFTLTYLVTLANLGDVVLNDIQVIDDLDSTYADADSVVVDSVSSADFSVNPGYDGVTDTNLLQATDSLAAGATGSLSVTVSVRPGSDLGPYENIATATGNSPGGTPASDNSTAGTDPDPDGDGNPGNNTDPTPVTFAESPAIGAAKSVSAGPVTNGDGTFTLTYTITLENTGDVDVSALQVTESLATTFAGAMAFTVDAVSSTDFLVNAGFDGAGNSDLLAGTGTLAAGSSGAVDVTVTVTPGGNLGPYQNTATVSGDSAGGTPLSDASTPGLDPDPDGDNDPGNNSGPTPVSFMESPQLGVAKSVSAGPVSNGDGSFTLSYTVFVENSGDADLLSVQVTDDIAAAYAGASGFVIDSLTSADFTVNPGFNGLGNTNLLAGGDVLSVGTLGEIVVTVTVTPGADLGPYDNTATGNAVSFGSGVPVSDTSTSGTDPDPDDDGDPGNNNSPTPVTFAEMPQLGIAKTVTAGPTSNGDGSFSVTYLVTLENSGDVPVTLLQITEDLGTTFAGAESFAVASASSSDYVVNPFFDGVNDTNLLLGSDVLPAGASATAALTVDVTPGGDLGPYENTATASGTTPAGTPVSDDSTAGTDPDPDGDGNPGNNTTPTPLSFSESPQIGAAKVVSAGPASNGDGSFTLAYTILVENTGDVPLLSVQISDDLSAAFPGVTGFSVDSVSSGDFSVNGGYDGTAGTGLLAGTDTLAPGAGGTVAITITVTPGPSTGPFENLATASGVSPAGSGVTDISTDGSDVDPDNDGDPGNNAVPTPLSITEAPELGLAKSVSAGPVNNGDGTYTLGYTIFVQNSGDTLLAGLQIVDDIGSAFAGAASVSVDALDSGDFTVNPGFDGVADTSLLAGSDSLAAATSGLVNITVTVNPGGNLGPWLNLATGSGLSPGGTPVNDTSTSGANPDPDGDGNPGNNADPTPVLLSEMPQIGAAKAVILGPTNNGDGSFTLTYRVTVENSGDVPLSIVQVIEDLGMAFAGAQSVSVDSVTSADFDANPGFDGISDLNLLAGSDLLAPGDTSSADLTIIVTPGANAGPYENAVTATGTTPAGTPVSDESTEGFDPDPEGDGPGDNSVTTPVTFPVGSNATVDITDTSIPGDTLTIVVTDADQNTDPVTIETITVTVVNDVTGETETLILTETGPDTGVFTGTVDTVFGAVAGTDNDGVFNTEIGHTLTVSYLDEVNPSGMPVTLTDTGNVGNTPPDAVDDSSSTPVDTPVAIPVLVNDSDPNGHALAIDSVTQPANGTVTFLPDGTIIYTPDPGFTGTDTFTYTISDGFGGVDTATVTVTVDNDTPTATADSSVTPVGTPVTIPVLDNDSDPNGDTLTIVPGSVTDPANGTVTVNPDGTVTYTPDPGFTGTDTFEYTVTDPDGNTDTAIVSVTVSDDVPQAMDDVATTPSDTPVTVAVLDNDMDPNGDPLTVTAVTEPANGSVTLNPDGTVTYTPDPGFTGTDVFTYTITDSDGNTDVATVTVTVTSPAIVDITDDSVPGDTLTVSVTDLDQNTDPATVETVTVTVVNDTTGETELVTLTETGPDTGIFEGTVATVFGTMAGTDNDGVFNTEIGHTLTVSYLDEVNPSGMAVTLTDTGNVGNTPPDAVDDSSSTPVDTPVAIPVLANDSDPNGHALAIDSVTQPANGTVTFLPDGTIIYTPDPGFTGTDTFTYTISDGFGGVDTATVTVTVDNDTPTATADSSVTPVGTPVTIPVLDNDSDPNGDTLTIVPGSVTDPANGTVTVNPDGTVTYTPDPGFTGTDTFEYTVTDPDGNTDTAIVSVTVSNSIPEAVDDTGSTMTGMPVTVDVLDNDTDPNNDPLTVTAVTQPANGSVTLNPDGTVTYTPDPGFTGTDVFTYTISDDDGNTDVATVTITVTDLAIVDITDQSYPGDTLVVSLADPDLNTDPATVETVTVTVVNDTTGETELVTLTETGPDTGIFEGTVATVFGTMAGTDNDGVFNTEIGHTLTVSYLDEVNPSGMAVTLTDTGNVGNTPPDAVDDSSSTPVDTPVAIPVLANDSDPNGHALAIDSVTQPANGTVTFLPDGTIIYTPDPGFTGTDTFTYTISDGFGGVDTATVTVTVDNDTPTATADSSVTPVGTPVTIPVLDNDSDPNGDTLTIVPGSVTDPANGTVTVNPDGTVTYTPDPGFTGTDTFEYTVTDPDGNTDTAIVSVTVSNSIPEAVDDTGSTMTGMPVTVDVLDNDTDPNNDPLTVTAVTQPANGSVTLNPDGTVTYTPDPGFTGTDVFTYTISDDDGNTDVATVTITVTDLAIVDITDQSYPGDTLVVSLADPDLNTDPATVETVTVTVVNDTTGETELVTLTETGPDTGVFTGTVDTVFGAVAGTDNDGVFNTEIGHTLTVSYLDEVNPSGMPVTLTDTGNVGNTPPDAVDDSSSTPVDTPVAIPVLANDSDPNGHALAIDSVTQPANGTVTFLPDGTIIYTPDPGFTGTDTFTYTISDGFGGVDTATVTVTVDNDTPTATADSSVTPVGTPVTIPVLDNDSDPNGDTLTIVPGSVTDPANGTVTVNPDGTVTYTPDPGFTGTDTFEYTVTDPDGNTDTAIVSVTVSDDVPQAMDDVAATPSDTPVTVAVLDNDMDPNGDPLTVTAVTQPANGSVTLNPDGTVTYTPDPGFTGTDVFTYTITDSDGNTDVATVAVTVTDLGIVDFTDNSMPGDTLTVSVTDLDQNTDPVTIETITVTVVNDVTGETETLILTETGPDTGVFTGTVDTVFGAVAGTDNDGVFNTEIGHTLTVSYLDEVNPSGMAVTLTDTGNVGNTPPDAVDDSSSTPVDTPVAIPVLANDSDPNGHALAIDSVTQPANGTVTFLPDGTIIYTPDPGFTGTDTFTYTISDGFGGVDTATVTVTVDNDTPTATADSSVTPVGTPVTIPVLDNDSDPNGDTLTIVPGSVTDPANGTVTVNPDGTVTYTPDPGFTGTDTFEYTVTDPDGNTDTAIVSVTVSNSIPEAVDDTGSTMTGMPVTVDVLDNDTDPNNDPLTVTAVTQPANGSVTLNPDGTVTYTPDPGFTGTDVFTYTISDDDGNTDVATVTITVTDLAIVDITDQSYPGDTLVVSLADPDLNTDPATVETVTVTVVNDTTGETELVTLTETGPDTGVFTGTVDTVFGAVAGTDNDGVFNTEIGHTLTVSYLDEVNPSGMAVTLTDTGNVGNTPPDAVDDSSSTPVDTPVAIPVLVNDSDPNAHTVTIGSVTQPANGTVTFTPDGTVVYTPNSGFAGVDTFTYTISDGFGGVDTATVTVTVDNDTPTATADSSVTPVGTPVTIPVLDNDSDPNGDTLTIVPGSVTDPANGTVTVNPDGTVTYTPDPGFTGTDTFEYTVTDPDGNTDAAIVTVVVSNDVPLAVNDVDSTPIGTPVTVDVLVNDSDPNGDTLTVVAVTQPGNGVAVLNPDGTVTYTPNAGFTGVDVFTYGIEDPDGNSAVATVTIDVVAAAGLSGNAWLDSDIDDFFDGGESPLSGWVIQVTQNGAVVATTSVAADGSYQVPDLAPGSGYGVLLRHPDSNASFGIIDGIVLAPGVILTDQDLAIDPSGAVYDSVTRAPVAGAVLTLVDAGLQPLPEACTLAGQQGQVTAADGLYRFDILLGADPACASGTTFTIRIDEPAGYLGEPSQLIPPLAGPLSPTGQTSPFRVAPQPGPPQGADPTDYYLEFLLADGDPDVIFNHLPLDPLSEVADVRLTKRAARNQVLVGDLVPYTVTLENMGSVDLTGLAVADQIPAGFSFVQNSARLDGDGTLTTSGQRPVEFGGINVAVGESATLSYVLRVGAGVTRGDYVNTATVVLGDATVSNVASASVTVTADPDFEQTTIIGKVFNDLNGDGWQDPGEHGIPGVRLATVQGLIIETDAYGRYHIAGMDAGFFERGRNFIIKVDPATLPDGTAFTTENPRVKRITQGLMNRFDFGVRMPARCTTGSCEFIDVKLGEVFFVDGSAAISPEYIPMLDQLAERLERHGGGTLWIEGNDGPCDAASAPYTDDRTEVADYLLTPRFGVREASLTEADKAELDRIAAEWRGAESIKLTAVGHTSNVGIARQNRVEFADNYVLSAARARAVADYLGTAMGLSPEQVLVDGRGPDQPVATNSTAEGRAKNRRVELQISGVRHGAAASSAPRSCDRDLSRRRAREVYDALKRRLGEDMIRNIDIEMGATPPTAGERTGAVREHSKMNDNSVRTAMRTAVGALLSVFIGTASAAEIAADCTIDSCLTEKGYAIQIITHTDDREPSPNDTDAVKQSDDRVDIGGRFLVRLPDGGRMWATEDPAVHDPRLSIHAENLMPVLNGKVTEPVTFTVYKNYDAFIKKAVIDIYHGSDSDHVRPVASLPVPAGALTRVVWNGQSRRSFEAGDELHFVLRVFDGGGRQDRTRFQTIRGVPASEYASVARRPIGRSEEIVPLVQKTVAAETPLDGNVLVMQPPSATESANALSYTITPRFESRKIRLNAEDSAELDRITEQWRDAVNIRVVASGHTDNVPIALQNRREFRNNQELSEARAGEVARYVSERLNLAPTQVQSFGYGAGVPIASNDTATGRAMNRRVELSISGDRIVRTGVTESQLMLVDPRTNTSVKINDSIEEALNVLSARVGSDTMQSPVTPVTTGGYDLGQFDAEAIDCVYGRNDLEQQKIPIYGSRVRLHGQDISGSYAMQVNGAAVPLDTGGKFATEYMLPVGDHQLDVAFIDADGVIRDTATVPVTVRGQHMFIVALADFTASGNDISGSIEPLSAADRYDEDFLVEGRLAFYLKGKVKGKYLVKAQMDTTEQEIGDLFGDLLKKDPDSLFRRLDPDRYYPVYGDDSTTYNDTESLGRLYLRADWDNSHAMWGDFNTGLTGTEFGQYNRSLYGAQFDFEGLNETRFGESRNAVNLFVSENQTQLGHSEFIGTGGSLYYLRHTDLLPGSEKAQVEIRDRDSLRVIRNITLTRGVDYEVDEIQGRVILARPLMQITRLLAPSLVKDTPLDGNDVVLLVDYEYLPDGFSADHVTLGGRVKHWVNDYIAIGATAVEENRQGGDDYGLYGVDLTLAAAPNTYIKFEYADSEESQVDRFVSDNGGLRFLTRENELGRSGDAYGVEARANSRELAKFNSEWVAAAWWRRTDDNFSVARRDTGVDTEEMGAEFVGQFGPKLQLSGRISKVDRELQGEDNRISIQADYELDGRSTLSAELRNVEEQRRNGTILGIATVPVPVTEDLGTGTLAALRYSYQLTGNIEVFAGGQLTLANDNGKYDNNDLVTLGGALKIADSTQLIGEVSSGHRGDGAMLSLDHDVSYGHNVYGTYTHSTDRSYRLATHQVAVGQRAAVSDQLTVFNEHQFTDDRDYAGIAHVFGLDFAPAQGWTTGIGYQTGKLNSDTLDQIDRDTITGTVAFRGARLNWSTRLEFRKDSGDVSDSDQWLTSNRGDFKLNEDVRFIGRLNYAKTDDNVDTVRNAKFVEAGLGVAYRPVENDRLNLLGKYTYLYDLRGLEQDRSNTDQRSNVFSLEGLYRLTPKWDLGGKVAFRKGELRSDRDSGEWFKSSTSFYAVRGRYHLIRRWDALAEFRMLDVDEAGSTRSGFLVGVDRHFGEHMKLGLGFNFTDFSDDLTNLDYDYQGWFINALGKY